MKEPLKKVNTYNEDVDFDYSDDEDEDLIHLAEERIKNDTGIRYSWEDMLKIVGITQEELDAMEDVEIE